MKKHTFFKKWWIFLFPHNIFHIIWKYFLCTPIIPSQNRSLFSKKSIFNIFRFHFRSLFSGNTLFLNTFELHCRSDFSKNIFSIHFDTILGRLGRERHFFKNMGPFKRKSLLMMALRSPTKRITLYFTRLRMYVLFEYFDWFRVMYSCTRYGCTFTPLNSSNY